MCAPFAALAQRWRQRIGGVRVAIEVVALLLLELITPVCLSACLCLVACLRVRLILPVW